MGHPRPPNRLVLAGVLVLFTLGPALFLYYGNKSKFL